MAAERSGGDYGAAGVLGMLTPQANTTVEPEFRALLPADWSMLTARLVSARPTIEARLEDYAGLIGETARRFANAPLSALAFGCTGASYLIGREEEARRVAAVEAARGVPVVTAARAAAAAMAALGARRIALLSPYPDSLNAASRAYWESWGFEVTATAGPALETDAFHPIYAMRGGGVLAAWRRLAESGADAVLMLGTGMPTLGPLLAEARRDLPPAVSCNVALAWASVRAAAGAPADAASLAPWVSGVAWGARARALFPSLGA
jgi:maleate cis-trans isomerase